MTNKTLDPSDKSGRGLRRIEIKDNREAFTGSKHSIWELLSGVVRKQQDIRRISVSLTCPYKPDKRRGSACNAPALGNLMGAFQEIHDGVLMQWLLTVGAHLWGGVTIRSPPMMGKSGWCRQLVHEQT